MEQKSSRRRGANGGARVDTIRLLQATAGSARRSAALATIEWWRISHVAASPENRCFRAGRGPRRLFFRFEPRDRETRPHAKRTAQYLIITLDDAHATTRLARIAKTHFPSLRLIARARDMRHMFELRDVGVDLIERETWLSAVKLAEVALGQITGDAQRNDHEREC